MELSRRIMYLRIALVLIGIVFIGGVYTFAQIWPSGWVWHAEAEAEGGSLYLQMIMGIYATLGVFLILAARDPLRNLSLIWFTVWSSVVHGAIMAVQSIYYPGHMAHLLGDVPALFIVAILLGILTPRGNDANLR